MMRNHVVIFINGKRYEIFGRRAFLMLADFLRREINLNGTKIVCAEGDCGACTVLCLRFRENKAPIFHIINACIVLVAQLDGCHILTVESLKEDGNLSAVQKEIVNEHGSQCGFCTPGFAMSITALFQKQQSRPTIDTIRNGLTGNLCRCTGYQPLLNAALKINPVDVRPLCDRFFTPEFKNAASKAISSPVLIRDNDREFFGPLSVSSACSWKETNREVTVVNGATDIGVAINKDKVSISKFLSLHLIDDLYEICLENDRIVVGARVTLTDLRDFLKPRILELANFLNIFASPQIKNTGTLVGNVANGSPIGDTLPFLLVSDGMVHVFSNTFGSRLINMEGLYQGYKTMSLKPDEIITHVSFSVPRMSHTLRLYKVSQRKDLDISIINSAFLFDLEKDLIKDARIAFGGVFKTALRLKKTESFLISKRLTRHVMKGALEILKKEILPISDVRGTDAFRQVLAEGLFKKYCESMLDGEDRKA